MGEAGGAGVGGTGPITNAACDTAFVPCGGDVVGTWEFASYCHMDAVIATIFADSGECSDMFESFSANIAGTMTFRADGTAERALTGTTSMGLRYSLDCLNALGTSVTVDTMPTVCASLADASASAEENETTGVCSVDDGDCVCVTTQPATDATEPTTTYSVSGTTIEMGDGSTNEYCVMGDTLMVGLGDTAVMPAPFTAMTRVR